MLEGVAWERKVEDCNKAMNLCPCGYLTDPYHPCRCSPVRMAQYIGKISGPLLDRIDVQIEVPAVSFETLRQLPDGETSAVIKARVGQAQARQRARLAVEGLGTNAQMRHRHVQRFCPLSPAASALLKRAMEELRFSARAYDKILKVSRTIADLAASETLEPAHLAEAIQYRSLDRQWRG